MFDIAWSELLLIAVVALIFIGPKELPQVLATLGRMAAKARRSADEFRRHFEESMRESGYEDLHKNFQDIRALNPANQLRDSIGRAITQDYTRSIQAPPGAPKEPYASAASAPEAQSVLTSPAAPAPSQDAPAPAQTSPVAAEEASKDRAA